MGDMSLQVPRLVAFDVDGTLLSSDHDILDSTRESIDRIRAAGTTVMIASGRPVAGLRFQVARLGLPIDGLVLAGCNGAVIEDGATGREIASWPIPADVSARMYRGLRALPVSTIVPVGAEVFIEDPDGYMVHVEARANGTTEIVVDDLHAVAPTPPKILVAAPYDVLVDHRDAIDALGGSDIETCFSSTYYYEVNAAGVSKGAALAAFCAAEGIPLERTVAFGDNENDITMLRAAGLGVAMGNAIDALKQVADVVTTSNDDHGIARVLDGMLVSV
ncbi:Cof-type HAD-IIB family hydrolase [Raineyella fluvialis]|uniref:Cof-type HAD-IIB family hydrolase n=1 Tax=Raineyella fluvialis TaxID=2662261 RepID=A0A5Q2FDN7_9ACTN|nr:Cof-type HAD-IIB family hydrolase [Raineyella fluvialis]QGF24878.1 Cof-type HAD-IIB family hydrolase [Raineyella fluvialis]